MTTSRTPEFNGSNLRQQVPPMPIYTEVLGLRRLSQCNDRQVLPTPMTAHIKANPSAIIPVAIAVEQDNNPSVRFARYDVLRLVIGEMRQGGEMSSGWMPSVRRDYDQPASSDGFGDGGFQ